MGELLFARLRTLAEKRRLTSSLHCIIGLGHLDVCLGSEPASNSVDFRLRPQAYDQYRCGARLAQDVVARGGRGQG